MNKTNTHTHEASVAAEKSTHTLPPDPDGMNDTRAAWAATVLVEFQKATRTDREDALADLLTDLLHWCDRTGLDFDTELARGRGNYQEETAETRGTVTACKVCGGILSHRVGCKYTGRRVEVQS